MQISLTLTLKGKAAQMQGSHLYLKSPENL